MFALFFSLYYSMFSGSWYLYDLTMISANIKPSLNVIGAFITSIFGDNTYNTLGDVLAFDWLNVVSFILALITCIGIVVVATKGIKKIFTVFFYGVR